MMLASVFWLNIADPAAGAGGGHGKLQVHVMQLEAQEIEQMKALEGFQMFSISGCQDVSKNLHECS